MLQAQLNSDSPASAPAQIDVAANTFTDAAGNNNWQQLSSTGPNNTVSHHDHQRI